MLTGKRQREKLKKIYAARLSQQAQVPKTTDLNKQSEIMLPQISVTNKRITEVTIPAKTRRRQLVLKPRLASLEQLGTEGNSTDGASVDDRINAPTNLNSTGESQGFIML